MRTQANSTKPLLVGIAGLLLGIVIGHTLASRDAGTVDPEPADAPAGAAAQLADLRAENADLRAENDRLSRLHDSQLPRSAAEAPTVRAPAEAVPTVAATEEPGVEPMFSFGVWGDEPTLRTAPWQNMGLRARDLVQARKAGIGGGQPPQMAALEKKARRELLGHLQRIQDRRQELRGHPIVVVNLMASHLQHAGQPLQPTQIAAIEAQGRRFENEAAQLQRDLSAGNDPLATEKKLRNIQLRKTHVDRIVDGVLTREQWNVLFDSRTKGLLYYDVYQVGGLELERPNSSVYWRNVRADAEEHLRLFLLTEWEISHDDLQVVGRIVVDWIEAVLALPKAAGHPSSALHIDEVLPCAELHIQFQKRIMQTLGRNATRASSIRDNPVFAVFPRLRRRN